VNARQQFHWDAVHIIQVYAIQYRFEFGIPERFCCTVHTRRANTMDAPALLNPVVKDPEDVWDLQRVHPHSQNPIAGDRYFP
jgi:hypothetical protein